MAQILQKSRDMMIPERQNNRILGGTTMKKKLLLSTVTAAALMFSGAAFNKAEAAHVQYNPTTQVTYKVVNQEDAQKLIQQYFAKYNVTFPTQWNQMYHQQQVKIVKAPTQQPKNNN